MSNRKSPPPATLQAAHDIFVEALIANPTVKTYFELAGAAGKEAHLIAFMIDYGSDCVTHEWKRQQCLGEQIPRLLLEETEKLARQVVEGKPADVV